MSDGLEHDAKRAQCGSEIAGHRIAVARTITQLQSLGADIAALRQRIIDNVDGCFVLPDDQDEIDAVITTLIQQLKDFADAL